MLQEMHYVRRIMSSMSIRHLIVRPSVACDCGLSVHTVEHPAVTPSPKEVSHNPQNRIKRLYPKGDHRRSTGSAFFLLGTWSSSDEPPAGWGRAVVALSGHTFGRRGRRPVPLEMSSTLKAGDGGERGSRSKGATGGSGYKLGLQQGHRVLSSRGES